MAYTKEQIKAAYALNLCTVSVSQIIEYEDLQIMEQEYEAILNNLNLEQIPKDEALLKILKQILDTIGSEKHLPFRTILTSGLSLLLWGYHSEH